jgi:hypothetical protein
MLAELGSSELMYERATTCLVLAAPRRLSFDEQVENLLTGGRVETHLQCSEVGLGAGY